MNKQNPIEIFCAELTEKEKQNPATLFENNHLRALLAKIEVFAKGFLKTDDPKKKTEYKKNLEKVAKRFSKAMKKQDSSKDLQHHIDSLIKETFSATLVKSKNR